MANLEEQLKRVKLKKSQEPMKDYSSAKTAGFMKEEDIKAYEECVLDVNTEKWIDLLKEETFPTVLCPFHIEEAKLFINIYKRLYLDRDSETIMQTDWRPTLSTEEKDCLDKLSVRLDKAMGTFTSTGFAFVKTSSRSAKDAPLVQNAFQEIYNSELEKIPKAEQTENTKITCLLIAAFKALRVKSASDVLDMFLRSERIYQDLLLASVNQKERYNENFVIREFVNIDVDMEFRGFVWNYELVALSQYNYAIFSERLVKNKEKYGSMVKEFYDNVVKPKLKDSNFSANSIIDFAVCNNDTKLWVIEVNPFMETTDGALFSWQHERHILEATGDFVFRITEKARPGAKTILPQSVRKLMEL